MKELNSVQLSPRVKLRPREMFRASGGPIHKTEHGKKRIGHPGLYRCQRIFTKRNRVFCDAVKLGDRGMSCGCYTLFIQGKPYRSKLTETIINRPYRVRKVRAA